MNISKFPKIEIIKFEGNSAKCWNFMRSFEECVANESIVFGKLNYVTQCCDEAKAVIIHWALLESEAGCCKAFETLAEEFDLKHILARTLIDKLLNFPNTGDTLPDTLKRLSRQMLFCKLTQNQMNYTSNLNSLRTTKVPISDCKRASLT